MSVAPSQTRVGIRGVADGRAVKMRWHVEQTISLRLYSMRWACSTKASVRRPVRSWRKDHTARDGLLAFAAVNPGTLTLDLSIGGFPLTTETVEVFGGRNLQEAVVELDDTLDELRARVTAALESDED